MTENELRKKVVATAKSFVGCKESDGSHMKIIDLFNSIPGTKRGFAMGYRDPWCAAFVSAVGRACGLEDIILPTANCDTMITKYKAAGRWVENDGYTPKAGDLIMYDWQDSGAGDNTGSADHVGIVAEVNGNVIRVIEGNISDAVGYRMMRVNGKYIRGFCVPAYGTAAAVKSAEVTTPAKTIVTGAGSKQLTLPTLQRGSKGKHVKLLQWLLIQEGYCCGGKNVGGIEQPDGDFGDTTYKSLLAYQIRENLTADGKCGSESWGALLK